MKAILHALKTSTGLAAFVLFCAEAGAATCGVPGQQNCPAQVLAVPAYPARYVEIDAEYPMQLVLNEDLSAGYGSPLSGAPNGTFRFAVRGTSTFALYLDTFSGRKELMSTFHLGDQGETLEEWSADGSGPARLYRLAPSFDATGALKGAVCCSWIQTQGCLRGC